VSSRSLSLKLALVMTAAGMVPALAFPWGAANTTTMSERSVWRDNMIDLCFSLGQARLEVAVAEDDPLGHGGAALDLAYNRSECRTVTDTYPSPERVEEHLGRVRASRP
jgi:hypothetical protein